MMQKRILVTGATGFIGRYLLPVLDHRGWQIVGTHYRQSVPDYPFPVHWIQTGDLSTNTPWQAALERVEAVVHLAGRAHILNDESLDPEAEFLRINAASTINLIEQAIAVGVQHFVLISSLHAMGNRCDHALTETSDCHPQTPYGRSKLAAEQAMKELIAGCDMVGTIFRPPLVYGKGNLGNMARLVRWIQQGVPLPLARIHNRRSLVYVENLVNAIALSLEHPPSALQTFLISDGQDLSTPDLIRFIAQSLGLQPRLLPIPPKRLQQVGILGDHVQSLIGKTLPINSETVDRLLDSLYVDSRYLRETLDWQPPFTLAQGFERMFKV